MRDRIVAGNWKMNNDFNETEKLLDQLKSYSEPPDVKIMIAPSFTQLYQSVQLLKSTNISVVAQNVGVAPSGAYTGEVSPKMLKGIGVNTVIIGHSERREIFKEDDNFLTKKIKIAIESDLKVIFCFGEKLEDRVLKNHFEIVANQLKVALLNLSDKNMMKIILAYEPVWAIGTGETASAAQAQEMHYYIRNIISSHFDSKVADNIPILYGGSVKPNNAKEIFSEPDVDGGLIGGASLNAEDFINIANSF